MTVGYKGRRWQALLTVSASGPEFSPEFETGGYYFRPRMAADLKYTTADVDFFEAWFGERNADSGEFEIFRRLRNPRRSDVINAIDEIAGWLRSQNDNPGWDGGGIVFCYAGHGRESDGALVLDDEFLTPADFASLLADIAKKVSPPGRLQISAVLDSCHSAAFTTTLLDACLHRYSDALVARHLFASCMDDEVAWEESGLGHGIFTYCFSVHRLTPFSLAATAVQADNSFGPSISTVGGELGCALLTAGAQNPVAYWNGIGQVEIGKQFLDLRENGGFLALDEVRARLRTMRDAFADMIRPMRPDAQFTRSTDAEMRAGINKLLHFLKEHPHLGHANTA